MDPIHLHHDSILLPYHAVYSILRSCPTRPAANLVAILFPCGEQTADGSCSTVILLPSWKLVTTIRPRYRWPSRHPSPRRSGFKQSWTLLTIALLMTITFIGLASNEFQTHRILERLRLVSMNVRTQSISSSTTLRACS